MRQGPGHVRGAVLRRRPASSRPGDVPASQQVSRAGTRLLNEETDWWGGDDNLLHAMMRAYQHEQRTRAAQYVW